MLNSASVACRTELELTCEFCQHKTLLNTKASSSWSLNALRCKLYWEFCSFCHPDPVQCLDPEVKPFLMEFLYNRKSLYVEGVCSGYCVVTAPWMLHNKPVTLFLKEARCPGPLCVHKINSPCMHWWPHNVRATRWLNPGFLAEVLSATF